MKVKLWKSPILRACGLAMLCVLTLHGPGICSADNQTAGAEAFRRAMNLQLNNRLSEALTCYQEAVQLSPNSEYFYAMGTCTQALGKIDLAIQSYETAAKLDPKKEVYKIALASAKTIKAHSFVDSAHKKLSQADYEGSIADCRQALQYDDAVGTHMLLATALMGAGRKDEAKREIEKTGIKMPPEAGPGDFQLRNEHPRAVKND